MLEELLCGGVYFSFGELSFSYPEGLKTLKRDIQNVRINCGIHQCVAINKQVDNAIVSANFDFSKPLATQDEFYGALNELVMNDYPWNYKGVISRPMKLRVDSSSIKLDITDVANVTSNRPFGWVDGVNGLAKKLSYSLTFFRVKFDSVGTVQYGGNVNRALPEKYNALRLWAMKKLPKTHTGRASYC